MDPSKFAGLGFTLQVPEVDEEILEYHSLLESLPPSDPYRPILLHQLESQRLMRSALSRQKSDFNKAITHLTEAILLSSQPSQMVVFMFFGLASALLSRFSYYRQPDDAKSSVKYFRFLRINFYSLEAFDIPHSELSASLFHALAYSLVVGSSNMIQDMEEMVALIPEFITTDILTYRQMHAVKAFSEVVVDTTAFRQKDTRQVADRAIQVLREAMVLNQDLDISYLLALCLSVRFEARLKMNDYEEAIVIAERIFATHSDGDSLTGTQRDAMSLISVLLVSRLNSYLKPEYFEEANDRIRTFLCLTCLSDTDRTQLQATLDSFGQRRLSYFDITGNSGETPPNPHFTLRPTIIMQSRPVPGVSDPGPQMREKEHELMAILTAITNGEIKDVDAAVERSRELVPLQRSSDTWSFRLADKFAHILFSAHRRTKRLDYLDEAITAFRGLRKMAVPSIPKVFFFLVGYTLHMSLIARVKLLHLRKDHEEHMQLLPELVNDGSGEVFTRFKVSCYWAGAARVSKHPSTSIAHETAMSLLQETLVFSPTLQTQHRRLTDALEGGLVLPSYYASYQIERGQFKEAIETLERGRALLWSEMRGLRTSTDQLRATDPTLANQFEEINQRLQSVTMSVALSDDSTNRGQSETGAEHREHSISHLVPTQRRLLEERNTLITHIQGLPGLENFLKSPSFDVLNAAAAQGPVIIINQSFFHSSVLILLNDSPPSVIFTPSDFHDRANWLKEELLRIRKYKGLDSEEYNLTLAHVLAELYDLVGKLVTKRLRLLRIPVKSRVWLCPTGAFCSLPLHAMGPIPSDDDDHKVYFMDLYITSYTPTLSALIKSQRPRSLPATFDSPPMPETPDKPSLLIVAQPDTLHGARKEIKNIKATKAPVTTLTSAVATPETVVERLRDHKFAHFVCHGILEPGKPFDASFELHGGNLTLLEIVRSQLPTAEFAFLSACHTAELTEDSIADEGLHLVAAMQYCGFQSVVGTMWAMADTDGADLSKYFYQSIFSESKCQKHVPYHERSAKALQSAVKELRKKRGVTLERWVNFVHYGA
ncbi:CHAT domain-containing protein [Lactarius quietus]|nr:CHAT domain-containing protein [Lactarius quietus]